MKTSGPDDPRFSIFTAPCRSAITWMKDLASRDPNSHHFAIVREALRREEEPQDDEAVDALARELVRRMREAQKALDLEGGLREILAELRTENAAWREKSEEGILWIDHRAASFLDDIGLKQGAEDLRAAARRRWDELTERVQPTLPNLPLPPGGSVWSLWNDPKLEKLGLPPVRFALYLARLLWKAFVKERVERARQKHPAVVRPLIEDLGRIYHAKGRTIRQTEQGPRLFSRAGEELALIDIPIFSLQDLEAAQRKIELLRSLTGHKALRHQIVEGHRRVLMGEPDPRRIEIRGGWAAYAEKLGLRGSKAAKELADVVRAEAFTRFPWPNGKVGNLLALSETIAKGQHTAEVVLVLGDIILPDYYRALPKDGTRQRQEQRQLIPIPPKLPPFVGRPNDHAAQAAFQLQILGALRARAEELALEGAAHLSQTDMKHLAERAELPQTLIDPVLERWTAGEDAFLEEKGPERYTLAKGHHNALEFLVGGGKKVIEGRKGGRIRTEKKKTARRKGKRP